MHMSWRRSLRIILPFIALPFLASIVATQGRGGGDRERPINASNNPLLSAIHFRSIGPASMGGRIDDIAVAGAGGGGGGRGGVVPAVEAGTYIVTLSANGKTLTKPVTVLQDRWLGER